MEPFIFYPKTKIIFGEGVSKDIASYFSQYKKVLLVYGQKHFIRSGLNKIIKNSLDLHGISYIECGGISPNPDISYVEKGLEISKGEGVEAIVAIGGGSVIDVAKCIAVNLASKGFDPLRFNKKKEEAKASLPVIAIPTIASAGSECSDSCVISSYKDNFKSGFNSDVIRPFMAIEDPLLTLDVSLFQTGCGLIDSMMHSLERYFEEGDSPVADCLALAVVKQLYQAGISLRNNLHDVKARSSHLLLSSFAHNGLTGVGKIQSFVIHPLEHAVSAFYPDIAHGEGIAILFPAWAKVTFARNQKKLALLGKEVFQVVSNNEEEAAIMCINSWKEFASSFSLRGSLKECGVKEEDLSCFANQVTGSGTRAVGRCHQALSKEECEKIYRASY